LLLPSTYKTNSLLQAFFALYCKWKKITTVIYGFDWNKASETHFFTVECDSVKIESYTYGQCFSVCRNTKAKITQKCKDEFKTEDKTLFRFPNAPTSVVAIT